MTIITSTSVRRFDLPRAFAVLVRPRAAFAEMASEVRTTWLTPMLILSITTTLAVLVAGYLNHRSAMMGEAQLPRDWQYWTPEMQNNYMQAQQATQGPVFIYVIPFVSAMVNLWVGWVALAGLLHLGSTLLGGRGTLQKVLNIVAWACLPFALRDLLRTLFMLLSGHTIISPGFSGYVASTGFMYLMLSRVDIFLLWVVALLVIGIAASDNLSNGKAAMGVVVVIAIALLARSGLGMVGSSLNSLGL